MRNKEVVRNFLGRTLGTIETDYKGDKIVRNFYGRMLGRYDKKNNVTRDFYGRIVSRGDQSSMLFNRITR